MAPASPHVERLQAAMTSVSRMLEAYARRSTRTGPTAGTALLPVEPAPTDLGPPVEGSALDALAGWFGLSPFEQAVVVLAAGVELSPDMANLTALAQGDAAMPYPTSLLSLAVFAEMDGAAQSVFSPAESLRHWRLIDTDAAGAGRLQLRLSIPDAILSFLIGQPTLDETVATLVSPVEPAQPLPSDVALASRLAAMLESAGEETALHIAAIPSRRAIGVAAQALGDLGHIPFHLPLARLAADPGRHAFARLWQRDRLGLGAALILSFDAPLGEDASTLLGRLLADGMGPVILVGEGGQDIAERAPVAIVRVAMAPREPAEVAERVAAMLGGAATPDLTEAISRFRLPLSTLESCAALARASTDEADDPIEAALPHLLPLLRDQVREKMAGLADPIPVRMTLDDLVVAPAARITLDQIVARHRNRARVLDEWGFRTSGGGAQGMSVVFAGPSGTGKTMAAEALAQTLGLDLYRVDLSRIVDKYIGETEKRLAALFDAADSTDAILLFDEADVLFGRRTEVKDSHDHYANLEVGYLLQRIEMFRGVAILTTNLPNAIDEAFSRRFAFSLHFEFPGVDERREIWRRAIPAAAPTDGLDWDKLARLSLSGGQIRVVVVNAAMLAADEGRAIAMPHVARALVSEYAKQRRRMPATELEGWPL